MASGQTAALRNVPECRGLFRVGRKGTGEMPFLVGVPFIRPLQLILISGIIRIFVA